MSIMEELTQIGEEMPKLASSPSPLAQLKRQRVGLTERLNAVDAAIAAMEKHPEVTEVLELLAKARH